jgi:hypothetical protein
LHVSYFRLEKDNCQSCSLETNSTLLYCLGKHRKLLFFKRKRRHSFYSTKLGIYGQDHSIEFSVVLLDDGRPRRDEEKRDKESLSKAQKITLNKAVA